MSKPYLPPREFLVECFDYRPETGEFFWKARPEHHFPSAAVCQMWNAQRAGNRAFARTDPEGYRRAEFRYEGRRVRTRASRVAFKMVYDLEPEQVDHKDRNPGNDAIENLRAATNTQNQHNTAGWSGRDLPKGVYRAEGRIYAAIWKDGRSHKLGTFATPKAAHEAYCREARKLHGEFFNPGRTDELS